MQYRSVAAFLWLIAVVVALPAFAASYAEQRAQLGEVNSALRTAERFAKADRIDEASAAYVEADKGLREVARELNPRVEKLYQRAAERLAEVHAVLSDAGAKLPDLPGEPTKQSPGTFGNGAPAPIRGVSFVRQVAPMLAAKCGRCHIDSERGQFSLATYELLMRGSRTAGRVLVPGEGVGSVIVDLISSGDMPRGGGRVTPAELKTLITWINEGAKFDGDDPSTNLRQLKPGGATPVAPEPQPTSRPALPMASGKETVSFAADVAPIFVAKCRNCHIVDDRGNFEMANFRQLGASGVVTPRNAAASTLVKRLKGEEAPRMPLNGTPLTASEIKLVETWIAEGGAFDGEMLGGATTTDRLDRVVSLAKATRATRDELNEMRIGIAQRHWRTALSDEEASTVETQHFLVMGALPSARLETIGQQAEQSVKDVADFLRTDSSHLGKSRVSLFIFGDRLDYSEFGSMVERRQLPRSMAGHSSFDAVDPYACVLLKGEGDDFGVTRHVAALVIAGWAKGRAPAWITEGAASVVAAKLHPEDARPKAWSEQLPSLARGQSSPDDFMRGRIAPESAEVLSYGFARAMLRKPRDFAKLLDAIADGQGAEQAIVATYGRSSEELAKVWVTAVGRQR